MCLRRNEAAVGSRAGLNSCTEEAWEPSVALRLNLMFSVPSSALAGAFRSSSTPEVSQYDGFPFYFIFYFLQSTFCARLGKCRCIPHQGVGELKELHSTVTILPRFAEIDCSDICSLFISGLKVNRLDMYGEKYKPFKGVKYITKAGKFQVRT